MTIIKFPKYNKSLPEFRTHSTEIMLKSIAPYNKVHFMSRQGIVKVKRAMPFARPAKISDDKWQQLILEFERENASPSNFVAALHDAFDRHIPFSISPEVIMTIISQEIAVFVKANSEDPAISHLFTTTPGEKPFLEVRVDDFIYGSDQNDWFRGIEGFRPLLVERVPSETLSLLTPKLSTSSPEVDTTLLISFMDAASKYFTYGMSTLCGIPAFRIEGAPEDWDKIVNSVVGLDFLMPGLHSYFAGLIPVLSKIKAACSGEEEDEAFWSNIYKIGGGSGGPFVNGWVNKLYAHIYSLNWNTKQQTSTLKKVAERFDYLKLNNFPCNISNVPFVWDYLGNKIPMGLVAGITSVEFDSDGFLTPKLGVVVIEKEKEQDQ